MRSTSVLFLIATATLSTACSVPVSVEVDCAWARPIRFAAATKDWLAARMPWPEHLRADLEQVARHNDKHAAFCGELRP